MVNFILNILLWTFAFYGFFHFFISIFRTYYHFKISSKGIYVFIAVKNQENKIEGFLKTFLFRILYGEDDVDNIFVVDLNSTDKTADILEMLSSDYDCLKVTNINNFKKILDNCANDNVNK